jgi:hypothetical protein
MEEALWMNLETSKRQQEWRDRSIAERKAAKRAHQTLSSPPNAQFTNKGEGPSVRRTSSTQPPSPAPTITTPCHQGQMEVDDDETQSQLDESSGGNADKGAKGKGKTAGK